MNKYFVVFIMSIYYLTWGGFNMNFLKKSISTFLAAVLAFSGTMTVLASPSKTKKKKKSNHLTAITIFVGTALGASPFIHKFWRSHHKSPTTTKNPESSTDAAYPLTPLNMAHIIEQRFIERLNSYPTEKSLENKKYISLSPKGICKKMSEISPVKRIPPSFSESLKLGVYVNLTEANALKECMLTNLCVLYDILHSSSGEPLSPSRTPDIFTYLDNHYQELATSKAWESNEIADIYMELFNFYTVLENEILDLNDPDSTANEATIESAFAGCRI